ncbi:MAG: acyl-CoA thioesterase [Syntrophaceae bacterium]|nr:acyl-CoA thioesterase [Syntrophaceae bacterium]
MGDSRPPTHIVTRLVKGADLNHHGTLFAGRNAEWFVESGFIAAAGLTSPANILCVNIHGLVFKKPVPSGSIIRYESRIVRAGRTSLLAYIQVFLQNDMRLLVDGFLTFVHVDRDDRPIPHGIVIPEHPDDLPILERLRTISA